MLAQAGPLVHQESCSASVQSRHSTISHCLRSGRALQWCIGSVCIQGKQGPQPPALQHWLPCCLQDVACRPGLVLYLWHAESSWTTGHYCWAPFVCYSTLRFHWYMVCRKGREKNCWYSDRNSTVLAAKHEDSCNGPGPFCQILTAGLTGIQTMLFVSKIWHKTKAAASQTQGRRAG